MTLSALAAGAVVSAGAGLGVGWRGLGVGWRGLGVGWCSLGGDWCRRAAGVGRSCGTLVVVAAATDCDERRCQKYSTSFPRDLPTVGMSCLRMLSPIRKWPTPKGPASLRNSTPSPITRVTGNVRSSRTPAFRRQPASGSSLQVRNLAVRSRGCSRALLAELGRSIDDASLLHELGLQRVDVDVAHVDAAVDRKRGRDASCFSHRPALRDLA